MRVITYISLCFLAVAAYAQPAGDYYKRADGTKGAALKTALCGVINSHTNVGYDGLLGLYKTSDVRADGLLWDMYSNTTNFVIGGPKENHSYSKEGDGYNREHTVPQSWFNEAQPMKSDAYHVVPTDGYVNNRRSNYPYGEVGTIKYSSDNNFSKLGTCTTQGYSGTVFEPNDEYKGDFARIYFYMVTCYENQCINWSGDIFTKTKYPGLAQWQLNMLLRWASSDPVSQKEIDRNNAVYAAQHNRNPFVDYPGLEQYIWGSKVNESFSYNDYIVPAEAGEYTPSTGGGNTGGGTGGNTGGETGGTGTVIPSDGFLITETFMGLAGNSTSSGGSSTVWDGKADNSWSAMSCYCAGDAVRMGASKSVGSITSPTMQFDGGTLCVSVDVKGWTTVEGTLEVSFSGTEAKTVTYEATMSEPFETKTLTFDNVAKNPCLTIATSNKRAFVDNIKVWTPAADGVITPSVNGGNVANGVFYSLSGQSYTSLPKTPGIYVRNGRKVVVK